MTLEERAGLEQELRERNSQDQAPQTPVITLTPDEVNWMTQRLVKLPYENVAPIIQLLGQKMLALQK